MSVQLEVRGVVKSFGGIRAIDDCSLSVRRGAITGIIGPNGAGKSTLFNIISGVTRPNGGSILFEGNRIDGLPPHRIAQSGVSRSFQTPREVSDLTTRENMMLVSQKQWGESLLSLVCGWGRIRREEAENRRSSLEALERVEIQHQADLDAGHLSIGQKKLLELARCMRARPRIALLDEPTAGVNPRLIGGLIGAMKKMADEGITLVIIEHNMNVVMSLCEHIVVMHRGRVLREGTPREIQNDTLVQDAYLGGVA